MRRFQRPGACMPHQGFPAHFREANAADAGRCTGETTLHYGIAQAHRLEDLGGTVTVLGRNADLGHGFKHALSTDLIKFLTA